MKTAIIYARYSSERQTEQSIEGQFRVCNEYAERNDIVVVDTYIDRATTGTNDNRKSFQQMLRDSNKKAWEIVLVYKLDRFSRNKYEMAMHRKTLKDNGVRLLSAMENIPDSPEGIILESMLEGMAEYYSAELSQKVKRGLNESRQKGNFTGGYLIYGYKVENKKVVIDQEKAEAVRFMYQQRSNGVMVKDIITQLEEKGILNRGKPFARNTVYHILANEKYSGIYTHNNQTFDNIYPQIVTTSIFNTVRDMIKKDQYGKKSVKTVYLLKGKIKCGYCGNPISAETGTSRHGYITRYYKCLGRKKGSSCEKTVIRKDSLENLVIETIFKTFENNNSIDYLADKIIEANNKRLQNKSTLNGLMKQYAQTEKEIDNFLNAIAQGIVTTSTKRKLNELEIKLVDIENKITIEKAKLTIQLNKNNVINYIKTALKEQPLQLIEMLIKEIILYDDRIEITFNYTHNTSPDDEHQGFTFYEGKTYLAIVIQNKPKPVMKEIDIELKF